MATAHKKLSAAKARSARDALITLLTHTEGDGRMDASLRRRLLLAQGDLVLLTQRLTADELSARRDSA